jgi:hypothetical protein
MSWDQDDDRPKKRRRRTVNIAGPLILITLGLVFLMANLGMLGASPWQLLWQWWPLIFIVIGLEVLIGVLGRWSYALSAILGILVVIATLALVFYLLLGNPQFGVGTPEYTSRLNQPLGDVTRAEVTLDFNVGTLRVSALPAGSENLLEARFAGTGDDEPPPVSREFAQTISGVGVLTLRGTGPRVGFVGSQWPGWDVRLSSDVPLTLKLDAVLGTYDLNLRDLQVTDLEMDGVMCTQQVQLPANGRTLVRIQGVMESLEVTVPAGTAARIYAKGLSFTHVDESRFPRRGDVYESTNFDTATNQVEIVIESVMSTVRVR